MSQAAQPPRPRGRPPGTRNRPRQALPDGRLILYPFTLWEAVDTRTAAEWAGVTPKSIRELCYREGLGRKVHGRIWASRFTIPMWFSGDRIALAMYHRGEMAEPRVAQYMDTMLSPRFYGGIAKKPKKPQVVSDAYARA